MKLAGDTLWSYHYLPLLAIRFVRYLIPAISSVDIGVYWIRIEVLEPVSAAL